MLQIIHSLQPIGFYLIDRNPLNMYSTQLIMILTIDYQYNK